jgi:large subunit ribosomal protein L13
MIIDATNLIVGRMAAKAAKLALLGERVDIVNCEKAIITGSRRNVIEKYKRKRDLGHSPFKGPYIIRSPDRIVKRIIRGMLPYKKERGERAFKRIKCHVGVPDEFENEKMIATIKEANVSKLPNLKYITIEEVSKEMGAK